MDEITRLAEDVVDFARGIYGDGFIPLHRPIFEGNERQYLIDCIDSNFVSSVGEKVDEFERLVAEFTGAKHAVATVNGTAALHISLLLAGVRSGDEVISQALTFVATCNAINYAGATPVFVDVDRDSMGLSPSALTSFLESCAEKRPLGTFNKITGKRISGCVPMHTFGFPCRIEEIVSICADWGIALVEDTAESLGSYAGGRHTGTFGLIGTLSFNGNKLITTGGGGMIITDDGEIAERAKHLTTTAKIPHTYEFVHDEIGYNYRMPNLNAALGCAQIERIDEHLSKKRIVAAQWQEFFADKPAKCVTSIADHEANHWLNAVVLDSSNNRDFFLTLTNDRGVMTRPIWQLMSRLPMFEKCQTDGLQNSLWLQSRVVNIPSSVPENTRNNGG